MSGVSKKWIPENPKIVHFVKLLGHPLLWDLERFPPHFNPGWMCWCLWHASNNMWLYYVILYLYNTQTTFKYTHIHCTHPWNTWEVSKALGYASMSILLLGDNTKNSAPTKCVYMKAIAHPKILVIFLWLFWWGSASSRWSSHLSALQLADCRGDSCCQTGFRFDQCDKPSHDVQKKFSGNFCAQQSGCRLQDRFGYGWVRMWVRYIVILTFWILFRKLPC